MPNSRGIATNLSRLTRIYIKSKRALKLMWESFVEVKTAGGGEAREASDLDQSPVFCLFQVEATGELPGACLIYHKMSRVTINR